MSRHPEQSPRHALMIESPTNEYEIARVHLERYYQSGFDVRLGFTVLEDRVGSTIPSLHRVLMRNSMVPLTPQDNPEKPRLVSSLVRKLNDVTKPGEERLLVARTYRNGDAHLYQIQNLSLTSEGVQSNYKVNILVERGSLFDTDNNLNVKNVAAHKFIAEEMLPKADGDPTLELMRFNPYETPRDPQVLLGFDEVYKNALCDLLAVSSEPTTDFDFLLAGIEPFDPGAPGSFDRV